MGASASSGPTLVARPFLSEQRVLRWNSLVVDWDKSPFHFREWVPAIGKNATLFHPQIRGNPLDNGRQVSERTMNRMALHLMA